MHLKSRHLPTSCLLLVLLLQTVLAKSLKVNSRPVHENINEQSRADVDKARYVNADPGVLEYGNPLAGNSKLVAAQKARIHSQHQQAMFLAERNRQQRAQILRFKAAPQPDSYMKAYHESHEKHHIDLENQQTRAQKAAHKATNSNVDTKHIPPVKNQPSLRAVNGPEFRSTAGNIDNKPTVRRVKQKPLNSAFTNPDTIKLTKDDAVQGQEKNRNHRSQGSMYVLKLDTPHYINPDRTHSIYVTAAPSYGEQGVTIKPHSNIGLNINGESVQPTQDPSQLFTESIPSQTQVIYPKQYTQMQGYKSAQELNALNSLLTRTPHDQLSGLNALLHTSSNVNKESISGNAALEHPIDLYFYSKDLPSSPRPIAAQQYEHYQNPYTYGAAYGHQNSLFHPVTVKDHTPITEQVDDIVDPNKHKKLKTYGIQSILATEEPKEMTSTTANNYYKVEVSSQTISGHKSPEIGHYGLQSINEYVHADDSEKHLQHAIKGNLNHGAQESYHQTEVQHEESERYQHNNAKGIHPLSSEYENDDNLHYAANYEFGYRVRDHHTGNDFGHQETKDGEETNGQYHVLLPDGRLQNVKYWAGPAGYHAHVSYEHA